MSELLGKETIDLYNTSETRSNQKSFGLNYQKTGKQLMTEDEIAEVQQDALESSNSYKRQQVVDYALQFVAEDISMAAATRAQAWIVPDLQDTCFRTRQASA